MVAGRCKALSQMEPSEQQQQQLQQHYVVKFKQKSKQEMADIQNGQIDTLNGIATGIAECVSNARSIKATPIQRPHSKELGEQQRKRIIQTFCVRPALVDASVVR